nr:UDP-glycosyltransferase 76G1-like [Tanacetum cinerariifolium]
MNFLTYKASLEASKAVIYSASIDEVAKSLLGTLLINNTTTQPIVARYVNDIWKIGVLLEDGFERVGIERAVKKIMLDEEGEEIRQRISCVKKEVDISFDEGCNVMMTWCSSRGILYVKLRFGGNEPANP